MSSIVFPETSVYLDVLIIDPEKTLYKDQALAVSSLTDQGPFDILPFHENFICMIKEFVVVHKKDKSSEKIVLEKGIMKVFENQINIFLGVETLQGENEAK